MKQDVDRLMTIHEASYQAGVPAVTVQTWITRGKFHPTYPSTGRGNAALFTVTDVRRLSILAQASRLGIASQQIASLVFRSKTDQRAAYLSGRLSAIMEAIELELGGRE